MCIRDRFHTGDLARVDEDGYYYITGRKKNLIILDSGENLSPEELEGMLEKCPAVQECIVKEPVSYTHLDVYKRQGKPHEPDAQVGQAEESEQLERL